MRYSKQKISKRGCKTSKRHTKRNCTKLGCKTCKRNRYYSRRRVMKGGWGGTSTSVPIITKLMEPFNIDDEENKAPTYGGWGELIN